MKLLSIYGTSMISRRKFIKNMAQLSSGVFVGDYLLDSLYGSTEQFLKQPVSDVFISKNGSPAENIAKVFDMCFGGIEKFIGYDDVVVLNPNGQWTNQGATNTACCMGMIELILNRPGGFDGEIIFCENTQFYTDGYWTASGSELDRNGPYNFLDMVAYYQANGHTNVSAVRIWPQNFNTTEWPQVTGPEQGQGWVRPMWQSPTTGTTFHLSYPIIRSPYSNRLIDLRNGVYDGGFEGQAAMKFIKMPTLNNHGSGAEQDQAGITSAVKSHLGMTDMSWYGGSALHVYDENPLSARNVGEAVGAWMSHCRPAHIYLTCAEWVGWESRTSSGATNVRTIGLSTDPVGLDYYMAKNVLLPCCPQQQYFDPEFDLTNNRTRLTLDGCNSMGYGTTDPLAIAAYTYDHLSPTILRIDIDRKILEFREGTATEEEVRQLIEQYNESGN